MEIINNYDIALKVALPYIEHLKESISNKSYKNDNDSKLPFETQNKVWQMTEKALTNTLKYLFDKLHHSCYMLCIMNSDYVIYKIELLDVAPTFKEAIDTVHIPMLEQNKLITESQKKYILREIEQHPVRILQCILKRQYSKKSENIVKFNEYNAVLDGMALPNGVFILNLTDAVILKTDGTEPFPTVTGNLPIRGYDFDEYLPILSMSGEKGYSDIPFPNYDDIAVVYDESKIATFNKFNTVWDNKKIIKAVFRGGPSGCGYTEKTNMRIKLARMKFKYVDMKYLDVALTGEGKTIDSNSIRFDPVYGLGMLNTGIKPGKFISMEEQSNYKYIIHIDGNVNAYRLLTTMRTGSLILRVKSDYISWVDQLIKPDVHYLSVNADLSNLEEVVEFCLKNNEKCKKIAENGLKFSTSVLQKPFIKSYVQKMLWALSDYSDARDEEVKSDNKINVQLGDIIEIIAPNSEKLNNQQLFVKYIDKMKIILLNIATKQQEILYIDEAGVLANENIEEISLLSRSEYTGYALQNDLVPGTWVHIYFNGDIPFILTGMITALEEDMIELKTYPDDDTIYIDFAYKGIPEELPIEKIVIRAPPDSLRATRMAKEGRDEGRDEGEQEFQRYELMREILLDADQVEMGAALDEITQIVDVPEESQRYGIDKQTNDLLDELLSQIPNKQRTPTVLNSIHKSIQRFKQLRDLYSVYDENGNISMAKIHGPNFKPLIDYIQDFKTKLYWLLPVIRDKRKLYDLEVDEEYLDNNDIVSLKLLEVLTEEAEINDTYKNNAITTDENKYKYLLNSLNPYLTPFTKPDYVENNIITKVVGENINTVTNNLDNFYSSVAGSKDGDFDKTRFVTQTFNTGAKSITKNDQLTLASLLVLPVNIFDFCFINSPTSNVLQKSNLNLNFLQYWKLLNYRTSVTTSVIESFDDKHKNPRPELFMSGIREYILDEELITNTEASFRQYIDEVVPATGGLFKIIRARMTGNLTFKNAIDHLSPFMVFVTDISHDEYSEIVRYIDERVEEYKTAYATNLKLFQQKIQKQESDRPINTMLSILKANVELEKLIYDNYGFAQDKSDLLGDSEILNRILRIDNGRLYFTALLKMDVDLRGVNIVDKFVDDYEKMTQNAPDQKTKCYKLAKKYENKAALQNDNNKNIYVDAIYLTTKEIDSEYRKLVEESDVAVLVLSDLETEYYIRKKNKWLIDTTIVAENVTIKDSKLFCNLQNRCISVGNDKGNDKDNDTCIPIKAYDNQLTKDNVKSIIHEFDTAFSQEQALLLKNIDVELSNNIQRITQLKAIEKYRFLKYNDLYNKIGSVLEVQEVVSSPYAYLLDIILGQSDFVKRQYDIQKFAVNFARLPLEKESEFWLYCVKTNVKLMPIFLSELANTFVAKGDYLMHVDIICAKQGTISEDGDTWVDKHSGYIIKRIDLDTEEGFTEEGYRLKTRDVMEKDLANAVLLGGPGVKTSDSPERKIITNIVKSITQFMAINVDAEMDFIVKNVMLVHDNSLPKEAEYEKMRKRAEEKGKKNIPSFKEAVNSSYLMLTLSFLLIAIQISVPPIKSRKTFPGCVRSFDGYPLLLNNDKSAVFYISCVANKIKSSTEPWDSIKKMNEAGIAKRIEAIIDTYALKTPAIKERFIEKINYLKENRTETVLLEHDIENVWINFLPPLVPITLPKLLNVSDIFKQQLLDNIYSGSQLQYEQMLSIQSKVIFFSLSIQEHIQKIVSKKVALITNAANEPFLENACCDTKDINTLKYFTDISPAIMSDNEIVTALSNVMYDLTVMVKAPTFFDPRDTKRRNPEFAVGFSEETIYRAFIVYCQYNNNLVMNEELLEICMAKPDDYNVEDAIKQKIALLKERGLKYDQDNLNDLLQVVNYQNKVSLNLDTPTTDNVGMLREILANMRENALDQHNIDDAFIGLFIKLLDTFSIAVQADDNPELRAMKNYLAQKNQILTYKILDFIKTNSRLAKRKFKNFEECLTNIVDFQEDLDESKKHNVSINKMVYFIREVIVKFADVFPNMVNNEVDYASISIPEHWDLSGRHSIDVRDIVKRFYGPLKKNYGEKSLNKLLIKIQRNCADIKLLALNTEYFSKIYNNDVVISSIFDERVVKLLFNFYFLNVFNNYLELTSLSEITEDAQENADEVAVEGQPGYLRTDIEVEEADAGVINDFEIIRGDKKELDVKISNLLVSYMEIICESKDIVDNNYKSVMDKVLRSREKEKDTITDYLKNLNDEDREIENLFKNSKLERWGKGLQKGLTQYVKDTYDEEREDMEKQTIKERQVANRTGVNDMNKNIYLMDIDEDGELELEIEGEVDNLGDYLGEDYEGDLDGDEAY